MSRNNGDHENSGIYIHDGSKVSSTAQIDGLTQIWNGVVINENVKIGSGVIFVKGENNFSNINIAENVIVGAGCIIGNNVKIDQGSILEPGSVVFQDVPAHAIVGGNPAKIIGYTQTSYNSPLTNEKLTEIDKEVVHTGVNNVTLHRFKLVKDYRGDLSAGEFHKEIPFDPKRYFLVFNVPSEKTRGEHAHLECHQFLICVKGSCSVVADDGVKRVEVELTQPNIGIYLPPLTWGIQYKYSEDAVLLVFASHYYDAADYIRNYDEFKSLIENAK